MSFLRLAFRLPCVGIILLCTPWFAKLGLLFMGKDPNSVYRWRCRVMIRAARMLFWSCGGKMKVIGTPPKAPFIMVSNHLGYMDIVAMSTVAPAVFVSKHDVAHWPVVGPVVRSVNCLFVDRENPRDLVRLQPMIADAIDHDMGVIFYPEGTSTGGYDILPFMPSLLQVAVERNFPVHFSSITYRTPEDAPGADEAICWWGDMEFFPHLIAMLKLKSFETTITFGRDSLRNSNRKELAKELRNAVLEIFTPVLSQENECTTP